MLNTILVLLAIGVVLTIWSAALAYRARKCLQDPDCGDRAVMARHYYGWLRLVTAFCAFVAMLSIMLITELTMGGMSTMWENISIVVCVGVAILVMFVTIIKEASTVDRLKEQEEEQVPAVRGPSYRHTN